MGNSIFSEMEVKVEKKKPGESLRKLPGHFIFQSCSLYYIYFDSAKDS